MSFIKSSNSNKSNLAKKLSDLVRENKGLRKKLSKLRKLVAKADITSEVNTEQAKEESYEPNYAYEECPTCRGEIKHFSVMGITYKICQKCKARKKIK